MTKPETRDSPAQDLEGAAEEIVKWFFECDGTQPEKQKQVVAILRKHFRSPAPEGELARVRGIYVASRASIPERSAMWRQKRTDGVPIVSTWIDEPGQGQTADIGELWRRIVSEISGCKSLVFYAEPGDGPWKGAFVEAGIALAFGKQVIVCLPGFGPLPKEIGSWIRYPLVLRVDNLDAALHGAQHADQPAAVSPVHPEHRCEKCGGPNIVWFVASPLWNTYVRSKGHSEILCPLCFAKLAQAAGYDPAWQLVPENPPDVACRECGQSINPPADVGGEYRCKTCGQNTVHDEAPAAPAQQGDRQDGVVWSNPKTDSATVSAAPAAGESERVRRLLESHVYLRDLDQQKIAKLREQLAAAEKEIDFARTLSMDFLAWRNSDEGRLPCNATRLMIEADNKRIAAEKERDEIGKCLDRKVDECEAAKFRAKAAEAELASLKAAAEQNQGAKS